MRNIVLLLKNGGGFGRATLVCDLDAPDAEQTLRAAIRALRPRTMRHVTVSVLAHLSLAADGTKGWAFATPTFPKRRASIDHGTRYLLAHLRAWEETHEPVTDPESIIRAIADIDAGVDDAP